MGKDDQLVEIRADLREEMGGFRSLPEYILDNVGAAYQRLAAGLGYKLSPSNYWLNALVIAGINFLIGWLVSLLLGENLSEREIELALWASATGPLALIANKVNVRYFINAYRGSSMDRMLSGDDIQDLAKWLRANFKVAKPLFYGLVLGPLLGFLLFRSWLENNPEPFHVGPFLVTVLASIQAVWVVYYFYPFYVSLPARLSNYRYDLYASDPSSSEVVWELSRLLTFILYITMGYIVQLTVALTYFEVLTLNTVVVFSLFVWAPTVILYVAGQFHLSRLITREKWKVLNEIQAKVESLYAQEEIPEKATIERLGQLMDYHDRVMHTPNSALNFRSSLNFLNSLLLPVLAFLIANIERVMAAIQEILNN